MLGAQLVEDTRLVAQQRRAEQGGTGTGQLALSGKGSAAGLAGRNLAVLVLRVLEGGGQVGFPELLPLPLQPTAAAAESVLGGRVAAFGASTAWWAQDRFGQHEQVAPGTKGV